MSNGVAAIALVEPALTAAPINPATEVETKIGAAVAAAVGGFAWAINDYADRGAMSVSTRTWCGTMLGGLTQMRLDLLGDPSVDFDTIARREGARAMRGHPSVVLLAHFRPSGQVDAVIDELIGYVITISEKVARDEVAARAN